jgi:hypothetical protein
MALAKVATNTSTHYVDNDAQNLEMYLHCNGGDSP